MAFSLCWTEEAKRTYNELKAKAEAIHKARRESGKGKSSKQEGLFKQVHKCITLLRENPRHTGLATHEYRSLSQKDRKVFEAYAQQGTPAAYRIFWCYGPRKGEITIIAVTDRP